MSRNGRFFTQSFRKYVILGKAGEKIYNLACIDWKKLVVNILRSLERKIDRRDLAAAKDTVLLSSARLIYQKYDRRLSRLTKTPLGVAIDRDTYRGQLIFHKRPILLPGESFIPLDRLNSKS